MSTLNSLLGNVSNCFFSFMIREIVFSAFLFILILMLTRLLRNKSPLWHMGLWAFVLIRLVLPPGFSYPVSQYNGLNNVRFINEVNDLFSESNTQEFQEHNLSIQSVSSTQKASVSEKETLNTDDTPRGRQVSYWKIFLFGIWLFGFLITSSLFIKRYLHFRRLIRNASQLQDERCHAIVTHWRNAFKVKRSIKLVYSRQCLSPFTMGVFKPVIYLPQSLLETDDTELLNSVISHEVAHIKHNDTIWIKFQNMIQSIYFFYPVVWYVNSKIHLARECLRDTQVISQGEISPKILGNGILSLLRMNLIGSADFLYLPRFGNEKKKVSYRLRNLKSKRISLFQKLWAYLFLIGLGAYIIPIFGSIQSTGTSADTHDNIGVPSAGMTGMDELPKERSEIPEDRSILASPSGKRQDDNLDSPAEQQKSLKGRLKEQVKPIQLAAPSQKVHLSDFVNVPNKIVEESIGIIGFDKAEKGITEIRAEMEGNKGNKKRERSSLNNGAERSLDRLTENESNSPIRLEGQYTPPKLIRKVKPVYPLIARQARVEGVLILEATTDEQGRVNHVEVIRSIPLLEQAAVEAVRQWIYEPMIINGKPRAVIFKVKVNFVLLR